MNRSTRHWACCLLGAVALGVLTGCQHPRVQSLSRDAWPGRTAGAPPVEAGRELALPAKLSLAEAQAIALARHADPRAAAARLQAAAAQVRAAQAAWAPTVALNASAGHQFYTPQGLAPMPTESYRSYGLGLSASYLLFDNHARDARLAASQAGEQAASASAQEVARLLSSAVAEAWFGLLLAERQLLIAQSDEDFNRTMVQESTRRLELGRGARPDLLNFQIRQLNAAARVTQAQQSVELGQTVLAELLGLPHAGWPAELALAAPPDELAEPATVPEAPTAGQPLWEYWLQRVTSDAGPLSASDLSAIAEALSLARPDLRRAQANREAARQRALAARASLAPTLAAQADAGWRDTDELRLDPDDRQASIGVALNWDLYAGGAKRAAWDAARAEAEAAEAELETLIRRASAEVQQRLLEGRHARQLLRTQVTVDTLTRDLLALERQRYLAGDVPITRLNEVQTEAVVAASTLVLRRLAWQRSREALRLAVAAP